MYVPKNKAVKKFDTLYDHTDREVTKEDKTVTNDGPQGNKRWTTW